MLVPTDVTLQTLGTNEFLTISHSCPVMKFFSSALDMGSLCNATITLVEYYPQELENLSKTVIAPSVVIAIETLLIEFFMYFDMFNLTRYRRL